MKILLLNPPASAKIIRDQYCSFTSKADYYWPPTDLIFLSGPLATKNVVSVLDAVNAALSVEAALEEVSRFKPDAIVALCSVLTAKEDLEFLLKCKTRLSCIIIAVGDIFYFRPELMIQSPAIDAICLQYPSNGIAQYLAGQANPEDMVIKKDGVVYCGTKATGEVRYPIPLHQDFHLENYRFPVAKTFPCAYVATSFGCPHGCGYCNTNSVPFRLRPLEDLFTELDSLKNDGVSELWFRDFTFNLNPERTKRICREMLKREYGFSWFCALRPENLDPEMVELMKRSGCHSVMIGVESANPTLLAELRRDLAPEKTAQAVALCNRAGFSVLAFVMVGLPGETRQSIEETLDFVRRLECDYLSFNIFTPRCGSRYARPFESLEDVLTRRSGMNASLCEESYCEVPPVELKRLRNQALLKFYSHPRQIWRLLRRNLTPSKLRRLASFGTSLMLRSRFSG